MSRIILEFLLPFVVPTIVYFLWAKYERRRQARGEPPPPMIWHGVPWHWLALSGALLVGIVSVFLSFLGRNEVGGTYVPPRMEDGRIAPAEVIRDQGRK